MSADLSMDDFDIDDTGFEPDDTSSDEKEYPEFSIINAPDLVSFIRPPRNSVAKEYETRVKSIVKSLAFGSLENGNLEDAATFFKYGPKFSSAAGDLADKNDLVRKGIDLITSPQSALASIIQAGLPMLSQLYRNHEDDIQRAKMNRREYKKLVKEGKIPVQPTATTNVHIPFTKFNIPLRIRIKFSPVKMIKAGFWSRTREPKTIVYEVFNDKKVRDALAKQGHIIGVTGDE